MALVVGVVSAVIAGVILAVLHIGSSTPASPIDQPITSITQRPSPSSTGSTVAPVSLPTSAPVSLPASPCVFLYPSKLNCASSDPVITLEGDWESSAVGCKFSAQINWGDGSGQTINLVRGPAGAGYIANHTYRSKRTFSIALALTVTSGGCATFPGYYTFTLG